MIWCHLTWFTLIFVYSIKTHDEIVSAVLWQSIFYVVCAIALIFAFCEGMQRFINAFDELNDALIQLHWYRYPIRIQRMLIPLMMNAQKSVKIAFFGSISGNREQFKKVRNCEVLILHSSTNDIDFFRFVLFDFSRWSIRLIHTLWYFVKFINEYISSLHFNM